MIEYLNEYHQEPKPVCSTHQVSTGEHCPEPPKHERDGCLLCDKCLKAVDHTEAYKAIDSIRIPLPTKDGFAPTANLFDLVEYRQADNTTYLFPKQRG